MLIRTEGIVIKTINYGEGSKILTIYSRSNGKISVMAKGARKTKSRINAVTQVFSYGEYGIFLPNSNQMGTLNQGDISLHFTDIFQDIEKTAYAAYIVELVDKLTEANEPNPFLFQQLLASLELINQGKDMEVITRIFEMKMFLASGYRPNLHSCVLCDSQDNLNFFSIHHGGLLCNKHENEQSITLQQGTIKLLRLFEGIDIRRLGNIDVKNSTKTQLQHVLQAFYDEYIGIPLKSRNFLDQMDKLK